MLSLLRYFIIRINDDKNNFSASHDTYSNKFCVCITHFMQDSDNSTKKIAETIEMGITE